MTSTLVVMAMNEIEGMTKVMPQVNRAWVDRILVVDGNSTDGTREYAESHGYDVLVQSRRGPRFGIVEAFQTIKTDIVVSFSPDGNCPPEDIPRLLDKMREGYDMVIASRYLGKRRSADDTVVSHFANWFFTGLINRYFGGHYTDALTSFRAFRTRLFFDLDLANPRGYTPENWVGLGVGGLSTEPLLSARLARVSGSRITEIESEEPPRIGGKVKFPKVRGGLGYLGQLLLDQMATGRMVTAERMGDQKEDMSCGHLT